MFQRFNIQFWIWIYNRQYLYMIILFFAIMDVNISDVFEPDVGKSVLRITVIYLENLEKTKIQLKFFVARIVNALLLLN